MAGNTNANSASALSLLFPTFALFGRRKGSMLPQAGPQGNPVISKAVAILSKPIRFPSRAGAATPSTAPINPEASSLQGAAGSASPSMSLYNRVTQEYDRRSIIRDCWEIYYTDPNLYRAAWKGARAAVGAGVNPQITAKQGVSAGKSKRAQAEVEAMLRRCGVICEDGSTDVDALAAWAVQGKITGDLFQQRVWQEDGDGGYDLVGLLTMPSEGMERLTDLNDQFTDAKEAFAQVDVISQAVITTFTLQQIYHGRWKRLGADRYGNPDYMQGRVFLREQSLLEDFQSIRRKVHGAQIEEHTIGNDLNPGTATDVDEYMNAVGQADEAARVSNDPLVQVNRFFHTNLVKIDRMPGDPNLHEVDDLVYMRERVALALDTPLPLLNRGMENMTRDTLEYLDKSWREGLAPEAKFVYKAIMSAINMQLLFKGMNPLSFNITLSPRTTTLETAQDRANFVKTLSQNTLGAGMSAKPAPLGTMEQWMGILAPDLGITDPAQAIEEVQAMMREWHIDPDTVHEQAMSVTKPGGAGAQVGSANSKNSPGATTGYGEKFENGKPKQSTARKPGEGYKAG